MRKVFAYLSFVVLMTVAIDVVFGVIMGGFVGKTLKGNSCNIQYVLESADEPLLIFGSSVAQVGIRPDILENEFGIRCFNAGMGYQNMHYHTAILESVLRRHIPEEIWLGLDRVSIRSSSPGKYISTLYPVYNCGYIPIDRVVELEDANNRWLLNSNLIRYNARTFLQSFSAVMPDSLVYKGFVARPLPEYGIPHSNRRWTSGCDPGQLECLRRFMSLCKRHDIALTVFFPPAYTCGEELCCQTDFKEIEALCDEYGFRFVNDYADDYFLAHSELFADATHLNYIGARIYTAMLGKRILLALTER